MELCVRQVGQTTSFEQQRLQLPRHVYRRRGSHLRPFLQRVTSECGWETSSPANHTSRKQGMDEAVPHRQQQASAFIRIEPLYFRHRFTYGCRQHPGASGDNDIGQERRQSYGLRQERRNMERRKRRKVEGGGNQYAWHSYRLHMV